ncbi:class I SAM-dependent methyltransferase [Microcoleus sp. ZQ-A2]|nr:class I SAM-dependent methyltransferase [Microcoleus sp. FACHB-1]
MTEQISQKTIDDFGKQWKTYQDNQGYYGSSELFTDCFSPLVTPGEIREKRVVDIGSGTGRIVQMLVEHGVSKVLAIEPASDALEVLLKNVSNISDKVTCLNVTGDRLPATEDFDYVFSVGVLHHIPEPVPVVKAAYSALKPGGKIAIWVYGQEGNELYLFFVKPLRKITSLLPHQLLAGLSWILYLPLFAYIQLCKILPLPLHKYATNVIGRMSPEKQQLIIYDQLNPAYAKYYRRDEVISLLQQAGFVDIAVHHRHGYSWTAVGTKPINKETSSTAT